MRVVGRQPCLRASEAGSAAVEMALVLPILLLILMGIIQFGMVFFVHNSMQHLAQEASRLVAVGSTPMAEAESWIQDRLVPLNAPYLISVESVGAGDGDDIVITISVPLAAAAILDPFKILSDSLIQARAVFREQQDPNL